MLQVAYSGKWRLWQLRQGSERAHQDCRVTSLD